MSNANNLIRKPRTIISKPLLKQKETSEDDELNIDAGEISPLKKHKRHKHKKHKKRKALDEEAGPSETIGKMFESNEKFKSRGPASEMVDKTHSQSQSTPSPKNTAKKKKGKGKDSGTSSEEERWLDAIESGKLEEVDDELKKIKNPKLMTARQRAMFEKKTDKEPSPGGEQLLALPTGYKEVVVTEEMLRQRAVKLQKRKQLMEEKREKDKKKTMDRLLRKQDSKTSKVGRPKVFSVRKHIPRLRYLMTVSGYSLSMPQGMDFPLKALTVEDPPKPVACAVDGCFNLKKYNCSKTGLPLCSIECYKKNLLNLEKASNVVLQE
ncbi:INO80 complex subunit B [Ischnura elegans]|uniref:INO80 complex subunit B n=1 Tax=Ischnura elegans TaxID=197161 RepID=UPI001ED8A9C3|nr:INO80 complex subunit B [Ischnura elegans]XP_046389782.1 INO80 complex subunit B [Ischnura elegans]